MSGLVRSRVLRMLFILAITVVTSITAVPPAQSVPDSEIYTEFYDCALNFVGWRLRNCAGGSQSGQQSGAWKRVETSACDGPGGYSLNWYRWTGSTWVGASAPYCTCC